MTEATVGSAWPLRTFWAHELVEASWETFTSSWAWKPRRTSDNQQLSAAELISQWQKDFFLWADESIVLLIWKKKIDMGYMPNVRKVIKAFLRDMCKSLHMWGHSAIIYIFSFFSFFFFSRQIECSSISEYSERIIKSNHLDSSKTCSWSSVSSLWRFLHY